MAGKQKNKKREKETRGITLIALVVTIIVLLLLAGISIQMLAGNNGILTRAGEAKEATEMEQLKEQAELVKSAMLIDKITNGDGELTRNELIEAIALDSNFSGSTKGRSKVITADEKYDVTVGPDLTITVVKHVNIDGKEIILTLEEAETESRAAILKVTATIDGLEVPEATDLENRLAGNTEELKVMLLKALNVVFNKYGMIVQSSWSELESAFGGTLTPSSLFTMMSRSLPERIYKG